MISRADHFLLGPSRVRAETPWGLTRRSVINLSNQFSTALVPIYGGYT